MGFRTGAYAKVWEVTPMSDTSTKVRMSISRKTNSLASMNRIFRFRPCHRNGGSKESCRFERGQPHQTRRCRCDDQVRQREKGYIYQLQNVLLRA